jgi:hypothetical protein
MKIPSLAAAVLGALMLSACVAPVGPVEVTRFHVPDISVLGRGTIAVEPAPGMDDRSLEFRSYAAAVGRQLTLLGYTEAPANGSSRQAAILKLERTVLRADRRSPVTVGIGGQTGSYGSGVGLGIGLNLSPAPADQVETRLSVMIRDRASGASLWEGRASYTVSAKSPLATTQLGAAKITEALFAGFPGKSGETIQVK